MGQLNSCCKPAIKDCDSVYKYCTPAQSSTSKVENHPHPIVDGKKERGRKEDAFKKKRRFWKWAFSHRRGGKKYLKTTSGQGSEENQDTEAAETPSDGPSARSSDDHIFLQHAILTVENHDRQDLCTSNPKVLPTGQPEADDNCLHLTVREWSDNVLPTPIHSAFDWSTDVLPAPVCSASDWSADVQPTPLHSTPDWSADIFPAPDSSASDWGANVEPTPVCSAPYLSVNIFPTPLSSQSDSSTDILPAPVHSVPDWSTDVFTASVHSPSEWSSNIFPAPVHSGSDWSLDVLPAPVCSASYWSADVQPTPLHSTPDWSADIFPTPDSSASDWSADVEPTPVCSAPDLSVKILSTPLSSPCDSSTDILPAPVHSVPDWSTDLFTASVRSPSDWSLNIFQTPAPTASDWSVNILQAPARSVSDWSVDVLQTSISTTEDLVSFENDGEVATRIEVINSQHYKIGNLLGEGCFGAVYEGSRLEDGVKVAVKFVTKTENVVYISIPGHPKPLPVEVALLILANEGPRVSEIIELLDWQDRPDDYIMVLERPSPCEDLFGVAERHGGFIDEELAQVVMRQATHAALMCCQRGVLHGDIKLENLLFNEDTFEVKLIDFGCGDLLVNSPYNLFIGTDLYCPPEYTMEGQYHGEPATVWSLGVLLFALVCGDYPSNTDLDVINANLWSKSGLSKECCHLIGCLLQYNPEQRIQLDKILLHNWLKVTDVEVTL
ncbi:uncharacterized protein LOC125254165 [Megalobrama amblycephala]|uniref:uncharacterized protein LOC125254165 n=1 Tax=Megalobrama amblycephala TaxID=75352 RepID=UPI0020143DC4|nr:uncharacterized protein LOC125254165 [Megalobrama amblycephala]XP_048024588.1 uncharacterized protein LOC125254165 [Megalobrama amblycephala]